MRDGEVLVQAVRDAAARHKISWGVLVPSAFVVDIGAEAAEDVAYQDMAHAKHRLRDHVCATYGISAVELCALAGI